MRGLFITGTGTEVGKTYVASLIARELSGRDIRVGVYKPVASGCIPAPEGLVSDDAVSLWEAAGRPLALEEVCPQCFEAPLAPHLAARAEGLRVDATRLRDGIAPWRDACEVLLVEGAGGLMSPLSDGDYNLDLAAEFGFPLLVVAPNRLGVINDTLQTLLTARSAPTGRGKRIPVAGVVLNDLCDADDASRALNASEIAARAEAPLLAGVSRGGGFDRVVDWASLAGPLRG